MKCLGDRINDRTWSAQQVGIPGAAGRCVYQFDRIGYSWCPIYAQRIIYNVLISRVYSADFGVANDLTPARKLRREEAIDHWERGIWMIDISGVALW